MDRLESGTGDYRHSVAAKDNNESYSYIYASFLIAICIFDENTYSVRQDSKTTYFMYCYSVIKLLFQ